MGAAGGSISTIDLTIMRQGTRISPQQQRSMCAAITKEMNVTLFAIEDNKSLGIDNNFSACFFKQQAWDIIQEDLFRVI